MGVGVHYFYIIPHPLNDKSHQTIIKRLDDSIIDSSWINCCKFKARSTT